MPFPEKHLLGVSQDSARGAGWARENRYDRGARQQRSPRTADRYLRAQWDVVGAARPYRAFTSMRADSTWRTETYLGFECAVLLVDPAYHPLPTLDVAPAQGGLVALVKTIRGTGTPQFAPTGSLKFSGYDRVPLLESWQMEGLGL
jgi:hypothetical protein